MSVLDPSIVAEVRETLGDDIYRDFVLRMLEEAGQVTAQLKSLLEQGDLDEVSKAAHRMAGSAVAVGAAGLHGRLKEIEDAIRLGQEGRVPQLIGALDGDLARTGAEMDGLLG